eukprot:TRINITY_DN5628_c0_g1_i1.p1 TRINITY_DN5628_c0_g1~~TRINITY_DN5628_c0_g1_i1.p1  ORF type:complete len:267 (+),score=14.95 TRINITY_DN5628_c0_g1_i1:56-802(+)
MEHADLEQCRKAAEAIIKADILLLCAGAGMSADSGLPVYNGIADIEAYRKMGVTYSDLCNPNWLTKDPSIFYGFWGKCYNDYVSSTPHKGYRSLLSISSDFNTTISPEYPHLKSHFVFTSNVDSMFLKVGFDKECVHEIHGTCWEWHCSKPCQERPDVFKLDSKYLFDFDTSTMKTTDASKNPKCPKCGGNARPRVLMFSDNLWIGGTGGRNYLSWRRVVEEQIEASGKKLVILEVLANLYYIPCHYE